MLKKVVVVTGAAVLAAGAVAGLVRGVSAIGPTPARRAVERLLSPGRLNREHADAACLTCHVPFRGTEDRGCLAGDCHSRPEIEGSAEQPVVAELHRRTADKPCVACHTEHRGGPLTVAFHTAGLAASLQENCAACHAPEAEVAHPGIRDQRCAACHTATADWKQVNFDHRLVEGERCETCHEAPAGRLHQVARGTSCALCHDTRRWEPARLREHPRIPEFGEHMREVGCLECHPVTLKQAVPCRDCHRGGRFGD